MNAHSLPQRRTSDHHYPCLGTILEVASTKAFGPGPGMPVYQATKALVLPAPSEALAELARQEQRLGLERSHASHRGGEGRG